MPRVKLDYVVSFSSEDPDNQASNLLAWEVSKKKWLCQKGEPSCSIVLQLSRAVKIGAVHVGCHLAATVEVLVGRSEAPAEQFEVLVPRCVVLSPSESRRGEDTGAERVRSFTGDQLAAARDQRWDRVRLVCAQPYNKHCKYGLSFVHIFEPEGPRGPATVPAPHPAPAPVPPTGVAPSAVPLRLTNFDTFSSDEEEFRPGEMFAKLQQKTAATIAAPTTSTELQIKQASSQALKNIPESSMKLVKTPINKTQHKREPNKEDVSTKRQRDDLMYTDDDEKPHAKIDHIVQRHKDEKSREEARTRKKDKIDKVKSSQSRDDRDASRKRERDGHSRDDRGSRDGSRHSKNDKRGKDDRHTSGTTPRNKHSNEKDGGSYGSQKVKADNKHSHGEIGSGGTKPDAADALTAGPVTAAPGALLADVVCVLSGYVQPARAALRAAARALGAAVQRDWGPGCTHLICAFPSTPKLKAVRAAPGGAAVPVVSGEWLQQCRARRRRLPCAWFASEPHRRVAPPPEPEPEPAPAPAPGPAPAPAEPPEPEPDAARKLDSEYDTDDEINEILQKQKKRRLHSPTLSFSLSPGLETRNDDVTAGGDAPSPSRDSDIQGHVALDDSDGDVTEPEPEEPSARAEAIDPDAALPDFFEGYTFVIDPDVSRAQFDRELLARYVRAYGGLVLEGPSMDSDADYVVSVAQSAPGGAGGSGGARRVAPAWVWRCHTAAELCPHT